MMIQFAGKLCIHMPKDEMTDKYLHRGHIPVAKKDLINNVASAIVLRADSAEGHASSPQAEPIGLQPAGKSRKRVPEEPFGHLLCDAAFSRMVLI